MLSCKWTYVSELIRKWSTDRRPQKLSLLRDAHILCCNAPDLLYYKHLVPQKKMQQSETLLFVMDDVSVPRWAHVRKY